VTDLLASQLLALSLVQQDAALGDDAPILSLSQDSIISLASAPAEELLVNQAPSLAVAAGDATEADFPMYAHQLSAIALVKTRSDTRRIRAWTFTQDDHDFYVLHLGADRTLVWDVLTRSWSSWKSPGKSIWRASVGLPWEQENIGGDVSAGLLWNVDPLVRDDDSTTGLAAEREPIRSVIRGMHPIRLRNALGCYRAQLSLSQGSPVASGVGITLRTSDDMALSWIDHGELVLDEAGTEYDVSWVSLGIITAPGRIFEIIDTGYARRIDALDIDLGGENENG
jgi:hypothetical protein